MKIHRKLIESRNYNEKHRFYDISNFVNMLILKSFWTNKEFFKFIEKLNELGFKDMPKQELFELFYNDEELALKIKKMVDESQPEIIDIQDKKNQLFKELDNLLLETFHTTSVMIDEQKLVNGEEGCLCNIDLEYVDNGAKQGLIDVSLIGEQLKVRIKQCVENILNMILENKS